MFRIGLKRNRIFLLVVVVLSPLMYHVIQEERRGKLTFALDVAITTIVISENIPLLSLLWVAFLFNLFFFFDLIIFL